MSGATKKIASAMALTLGVASILTGCGVTAAKPTTTAAAFPSEKHLKGTLRIFSWCAFNCGPPGSIAGKALIVPYEKSHPGVAIKEVSPPSSDADWVLWEDTVLAGGTAPEIISPAVGMQPWPDISRGWYVNLTSLMNHPDPYVPGNKHMRDLFSHLMRQEYQYNGQYYSISFTGQDAGIWYNKTLFKKAGIGHVPTTWAQFFNDMAKLKKLGVIPMGMDLGDTTYGDPIPSLMAALESNTMQPVFNKITGSTTSLVTPQEFVKAIDNGTFSVNSPGFAEAWRLLKAWSAYFQPGAVGDNGQPPTGSAYLFMKGKVAMFYAGSYVIPTLNSAHLPFKYGVFPIPQLTKATWSKATSQFQGTGVWSDWGAWPFAVTNTAVNRHKLALAYNFLQYLAKPQNQQTMAEDLGMVPLTRGEPLKGPADIVQPLTEIKWIMNHPSRISEAETLVLGPGGEQAQVKIMEEYVDGSITLKNALSQEESVLQNAASQALTWINLKS